VPFQERAIRRCFVDVAFLYLDAALLQKTSGVATRGSGGLPEEGRLGHPAILPADSRAHAAPAASRRGQERPRRLGTMCGRARC
jgi:hypothetical protein